MKTRVPKGSVGSNPTGVAQKEDNMALHNRRYYRIQRQKHINRKRELSKSRIITGTMNMKAFLVRVKFIAVVGCVEVRPIIKGNIV